jgi:hypothetical protein
VQCKAGMALASGLWQSHWAVEYQCQGDWWCHWNWAMSCMAVQALLAQWLMLGQSSATEIEGSMSGIGGKVDYHAWNMTHPVYFQQWMFDTLAHLLPQWVENYLDNTGSHYLMLEGHIQVNCDILQ